MSKLISKAQWTSSPCRLMADESARKDAHGREVATKFRDLLWRWHKDLPPEIRMEEMFHLSQRLPKLFARFEGKCEEGESASLSPEALRAEMERVLKAIDSADARGKLPTGVGTWFRSLERRIPNELWNDGSLGDALRRAYVAVYKEEARQRAPFVLGPKELQIIHRGEVFAPKRWRVWQVGDPFKSYRGRSHQTAAVSPISLEQIQADC